MLTKTDWQRPNNVERPSYKPQISQEQFIVPLLKEHIDHVLNTYASPAPVEGRALDVGCGRQPFRQELENLGYAYYSMDVTQNPEETVDFLCELDKPLPAKLTSDRPFNFIFCTEVMEHIADWEMAFSNFAQLLAPGGKLFITCPHFYQIHEEPYDFWRPTPYALQYFADKYQLKTIYQVNAGNAWDVLGTALGSCYCVALSRKLSDRIINKIFSMCQHLMFKILVSRQLAKYTNLDGPLYLANVIVMEKSV
jgi:2-polyprenyl-3-methyl-5-hydroxy-6-metoxy-1,4-benzoquinol methylase